MLQLPVTISGVLTLLALGLVPEVGPELAADPELQPSSNPAPSPAEVIPIRSSFRVSRRVVQDPKALARLSSASSSTILPRLAVFRSCLGVFREARHNLGITMPHSGEWRWSDQRCHKGPRRRLPIPLAAGRHRPLAYSSTRGQGTDSALGTSAS